MRFRSNAPGFGGRLTVTLPPVSTVFMLATLGMAVGWECESRGAAPLSSLGSGLKAVSRAASRALGGKSDEPPKQASRLPLPPDAHADDDTIRAIARPPIGEGTEPSGIESKLPKAGGSTKPASSSAQPAKTAGPIASVEDLLAFASSIGTSAKTIVTASLDPSYSHGGGTSAVSARNATHSGGTSRPTSMVASKQKQTKETPDSPKGETRTTQGRKEPADSSSVEAPLAPATLRHSPQAWAAEGTALPPPKNQRFDRLRKRIAQTLATYKRRPLNTQDHTPWEVMHGFLAFGISTEIRVGGPRGGLINAIGWVNSGGRCHGQTMLATNDDHIVALKGIGVQGHSAQYLAILAQCRVAANSPLTPQKKSFTVADLIEQEKLDCKSKTELTFALIGLAHYLPTDATWKSRDGQSWSLERLVAEELEQPIRGAPCGGSHRLFGLAYGCQRRLRATGALDGTYERADTFVRDYQLMTLTKLQNPDGSFSTEWYKFPTAQNREDDIDRKIQTTGHMLEWLVASLDQESLYHARVTRAVEFLTWALASEPNRQWAVGPMCHALHALSVYQERVWGVVLPGAVAAFKGPMKAAAERELQLAEKPTDIEKPTVVEKPSEEDEKTASEKPSRKKAAVRR